MGCFFTFLNSFEQFLRISLHFLHVFEHFLTPKFKTKQFGKELQEKLISCEAYLEEAESFKLKVQSHSLKSGQFII